MYNKLLKLIREVGMNFHGAAKFYGREWNIPYVIGLLIVVITIPINILVGLFILIKDGLEGFNEIGMECCKVIFYEED